MSSRTSLSDSQLLEYSGEHLLYELFMFHWLAQSLPTRNKSFELSALLESFAIHLRNLIDFFYPSNPPREDDIVAADFFDDPTKWRPGTMSAALDLARERANKEVSHMTHKRKTADDPTKPWQVGALFMEIDALATTFASEASSSKLHRGVVELQSASATAKTILVSTTSTATTNTASQTISYSASSPKVELS